MAYVGVEMKIKHIESGINEQAIDQLKILLEAAKDGEITELVAIVKWKDDQGYSYCWTGSNDLYKMVGAIEALKQRTVMRLRPLLDRMAEANCIDEIF